MARRFFLIDGSYFCHRAFHSPGARLTSPSGEPTRVIHQVLGDVQRIIATHDPFYIAFITDGPKEFLHRRKISKDYKSNRPPSDPELRQQMARIESILKLCGIFVWQCRGYESDDLLASLAVQYASEDMHCTIVSRDKDLMSLTVNPHIRQLDYANGMWMDKDAVHKRLGVEPHQIPDYLALLGDSADNIPGVAGWGAVTAAKFLARYGTLEAICDAAAHASEPIPPRLVATLGEACNSGSLDLAKRLIKLNTTIDLHLEPSQIETPQPFDFQPARAILKALGFTSLHS